MPERRSQIGLPARSLRAADALPGTHDSLGFGRFQENRSPVPIWGFPDADLDQ
jgi:hypothetical protein